MDAGTLGVLIPILVPLGFFALIFGIIYLRSREKMAMIERGMDPRLTSGAPNRNYVLTAGLLLIGAGLGLFLAYILDVNFFPPNYDSTAIYFGLIAIFGGLGLFTAYLIEKKEAKKRLEE
jgi:hypothetical protein